MAEVTPPGVDHAPKTPGVQENGAYGSFLAILKPVCTRELLYACMRSLGETGCICQTEAFNRLSIPIGLSYKDIFHVFSLSLSVIYFTRFISLKQNLHSQTSLKIPQFSSDSEKCCHGSTNSGAEIAWSRGDKEHRTAARCHGRLRLLVSDDGRKPYDHTPRSLTFLCNFTMPGLRENLAGVVRALNDIFWHWVIYSLLYFMYTAPLKIKASKWVSIQ